MSDLDDDPAYATRPAAADSAALARSLPFLKWWPRVNRHTTRADLVAGLSGAILGLPQGVAFAILAGLPPEYGIYAAIVPPMLSALFGSSFHMVAGPTNAVAIRVCPARPGIRDVKPDYRGSTFDFDANTGSPACSQLKMLRINGSIFFRVVEHVGRRVRFPGPGRLPEGCRQGKRVLAEGRRRRSDLRQAGIRHLQDQHRTHFFPPCNVALPNGEPRILVRGQ